jgi:hypothetical protein
MPSITDPMPFDTTLLFELTAEVNVPILLDGFIDEVY